MGSVKWSTYGFISEFNCKQSLLFFEIFIDIFYFYSLKHPLRNGKELSFFLNCFYLQILMIKVL